MANEGIELEVYGHDDPFTKLDTLRGRQKPTFLDEIGGNGGGNFLLSKRDPQYAEDPTLVDYRNSILYKVNGLPVGRIIITKQDDTIIGEGESKDEAVQVTGEGPLVWFEDAAVQPYGGLKLHSPDNRVFSFASERGDWYTPHEADWINPYDWGVIHSWPVLGDSPSGWPQQADNTDVPAHWIWGVPVVDPAPAGNCYFRYEFTTTVEATYIFYAAGDNALFLYVDGAQVAQTQTGKSAYDSTTKVTMILPPGDHVVAAMVENYEQAANNPAGLVLAAFTTDGSTETLQFKTGDAGWKVNAYPSYQLGWNPGEVILTLLAEAEDRGVRFPTWLTPTFTTTHDSNGNTWDQVYEWSFGIGEGYDSVISKMGDITLEIWVEPDTLNLNIAPARGEDRTVDPGAVVFERGKNLLSAKSAGVGKVKNALVFKTADGYLLEDNTDDASITVYGTLEGAVSADVPQANAEALATVIFSHKATPEEAATYTIVDTDDTPWDSFGPGDMVLAPDKKLLSVDRRVMSISLSEADGNGKPLYALEFDTIFQSNDIILNKILQKTSGGSTGATLASTDNLSSSGAPIVIGGSGNTRKIPKFPTGLNASSAGYWTADGVTPYAQVHLTWDAVTQNTDLTATVPAFYEVWGRPTANADDAYQLFSQVTSNEVYIQPFQPASEWTFEVRAMNDADTPSAFSATVDHTMAGPTAAMDAPDTPTLSSSLGLLTVTWDGKLNGNDPPPQFRYVYAQVKPHSSGTYQRMGPALTRDGRNITIAGLVIGTSYDVKLVAVDGSGIASAASTSATISIIGIDLGDLDAAVTDAIDAAHDAAIDAKQSTNLLFDGSFEDSPLIYWALSAGTVQETAHPRSGTHNLKLTTNGTVREAATYAESIPCQPGDQFYFGIYVKPASATWSNQNIGFLVHRGDDATVSDGTDTVSLSLQLDPSNYLIFESSWVAPADTYYFKPELELIDVTSPSGTIYYVDDVRILLMVGETLIIDGSIVTNKLAADSVTAGKVAADAIAAENIQAGAIVAGKLAVGAVTAATVAAGAISTNALAAGSVTVDKIAAGVGGQLDLTGNSIILEVTSDIDGVASDLDATAGNLADMQTYYSFSPSGAVISTPSSPFAVSIQNDKIAMLENGNVVSYWNSGTMYVNQLVATILNLGNHQVEKYGTTDSVVKALS